MGKSTVDASAGFGLRDKLAYAAGDFGCNMSFALKGYLTIYWTQFMGIDNYLMASPSADRADLGRNQRSYYRSNGRCGYA